MFIFDPKLFVHHHLILYPCTFIIFVSLALCLMIFICCWILTLLLCSYHCTRSNYFHLLLDLHTFNICLTICIIFHSLHLVLDPYTLTMFLSLHRSQIIHLLLDPYTFNICLSICITSDDHHPKL